ncbi:hypothetical protein RJT34_03140 [Clitoria ternatea]|uniref:Cation/H+ exchanger domain-containing protein n=1 Tax=Clitoria ternatea TaxID=43366 RepID=A0AAN9Q294_CLITE
MTFSYNSSREIVCYSATMVTCDGIWAKGNPLHYSLPLFLIQLMLVIVATRVFVFILKPIHQPRVLAEMLGGIILGPSVLGRNKRFSEAVFPLRSVIMIETMANVGLLYFMFLVGVGMDASAIKLIGKKAATVAIAGMVLPFAIGTIFSFFFIKLNETDTTSGAYVIFLGVVISVTAFPVLARILAELKLANTEIGKVALSAALINDVLSWLLLALSFTMIENAKPSLSSLIVLLSSVVFVALNIFAVRPLISWIIRSNPEGQPFSDFHICMILAGVMVSGLITDAIGTHSIFGAFVFGLTIPNGPLGHTLVERLEDFISGLFLPLFFATSGLKTDLGLIIGVKRWVVLILIVIASCIGKILGTLAVAVSYQMSITEGVVLGLLMNAKGLVEFVVLNIGKDHKVLNEESFASMVVITILMTGIIVPVISFIYKPSRTFISYKRRTVQMTRNDAEFRVLVCVHTPKNVPTIINFLEASNPTKNSPICIYVLNLVELTGLASALLIVHSPGKSNRSASNRAQAQTDHIINAFENYEQHASHISVQPLTAISPFSTMHEDVCNLAQDKRVSFIIIPFHKIRTIDGQMEITNAAFRSVNRNVLNSAPCSVGILVDRGLDSSNPFSTDDMSHNVALLFFGGADDREALSYAWRMSEHPGVSLTVMRFVAREEAMHHQHHDINSSEAKSVTVETGKDKEKHLDDKFIHWFRMSHVDDDSVVYVEKEVNNGEQTVAAIRSMGGVHDLFIVGRGRGMISSLTAGLTDWSECPELGAIGDLLASSDFVATASVLVVQQYVGEELELEADMLETLDNMVVTNKQ